MSISNEKIKELCKAKSIKIQGIEYLIKYYQKSLGWTEQQAIEYTLGLFEDGTIYAIMVISKKGGNNDATNR